jgi:phosphoribosylamine--glycine ligase
MARHSVPTARFRVCDDVETAMECLRSEELGFPVVLKADGLADGKGVIIAADRVEAEAVVNAAMSEHKFGDAGKRLVIEECLSGPEVSFFVISDGTRAFPIGTAQDHKRIFDDDRGPNTGGMGAFAPSPLIGSQLEQRIMDAIVAPVIGGMKTEGCPFCGFLYVGLMLTSDGPKVIEFNVRFGDPEAQVILPLISSPLMPLLIAAQAGQASDARCQLSSDRSVGVVIASRGYPESSESGQPIDGLKRAAELPGVFIYHAGTAERDGRIVTAGGRVLTVVGRGATYEEATARAYAGVAEIKFDGMQYRRDIGRKAIHTPA